MCNLTPEPSIGDVEDNTSIRVAVGSTCTDKQCGPRTLSVPSAGASRVPTPDPTPTRHGGRSLAAVSRGQDLDSQQHHSQLSPGPARPPFDASYVVDLVPRPETTSPISHGTKRMRSFEEIMNETRTPAKDKMTQEFEDMQKKLGSSDQVAGEGPSRDNKRRKLPIRSSARIAGLNAEQPSRGSGDNDSSGASSQENGSQNDQSSQPLLEKT